MWVITDTGKNKMMKQVFASACTCINKFQKKHKKPLIIVILRAGCGLEKWIMGKTLRFSLYTF